jgi:D-glycero-alpha-D-manno-heptose-7-phosphate kinase
MIISRTPMRISFFGGGTDYNEWLKNNNGSIISTTINKYNYINVRYLPQFFKYKNCIRYYKREETKYIKEIKHNSVRETLKFLKIKNGIEIIHNADLPARGGLGSSSSFTVGLLNALYALNGKMISKRNLAKNAIEIEQNKIRENVGLQDQIATSFGGFNRIDFNNDNFVVSPITLSQRNLFKLQKNLLLVFTGFQRNASDIAKHQIQNINKKKKELNQMLEIVNEGYKILSNKSIDINKFGNLLHKQWLLKKKMSQKITNNKIDKVYNEALNHGALGGKLLGAGGGGFMIFCANLSSQKKIIKKLSELNCINIPFRFDYVGSQIIYHDTNI